jgi:hypothetical protein
MVHWETLTVIESSENWWRVGRPNWDLKARLDSLGTFRTSPAHLMMSVREGIVLQKFFCITDHNFSGP